MDRNAAERAISAFLTALGHDPTQNPELSQTPARVTAAFADDLLRGHAVDIRQLIEEGSSPHQPGASEDFVVLRDVSVVTMCPHHLLPALGSAVVAYVPGGRLLGLGTIAAMVDAFARRLTFQETIGKSVVEALVERAEARGAYCKIKLQHGCLSARGECQASARVETVALAGALTRGDLAAKWLTLLG